MVDQLNSFYNWGKIPLVCISGPDAPEFLHRLTSQDFKTQKKIYFGAFLNGQARLIGLFTAWVQNNSYFLFLEPRMFEKTFSYITQMHFSEDLKIEKQEQFVVEARGNNVPKVSENCFEIEAYNWGLPGKLILNNSPITGLDFMPENDWNSLRASYGYPLFGVDITEDNILIEAPFDDLVHRSKGCYPGQEVIEKIYTYGRVSQKILRIHFEKSLNLELPYIIKNSSDEKIGVITSVYSKSGSSFGLATLKRSFYEKADRFYIEGKEGPILATIVQAKPAQI